MKTTLMRRTLAATSLLLAAVLLAGCNDDSSSADSGSSSGGPTSLPVPSGQGNPFSWTITGPDHGTAGQTISVSLKNTGRLPDAYQLIIDPGDAATVVSDANAHLSPGESATFRIKVNSTPFDVHVKSVGGGVPDKVALQVN